MTAAALFACIIVAGLFFFLVIRPRVRQLRGYEAEIKRISRETDTIYERMMRR